MTARRLRVLVAGSMLGIVAAMLAGIVMRHSIEQPVLFAVAASFWVGIALVGAWMYVSLIRTPAGSVIVGGILLTIAGWIAFGPKDDGLEAVGLLYPLPVVALATVVEGMLPRR